MSLIKILIVDDEDLIRERFAKAFPFSQYGYEIIGEASNGVEALELCKSLDIDVVITDIVMPLMNGIEMTKRIREKYPYIKIILLSSHEEFSFAQKAISLGASEYLLKASAEFHDILKILDRLKPEILSSHRIKDSSLTNNQHLNRYELNKEFIKKATNANSNITKNEFLKELSGADILTDLCIIQVAICDYNNILDTLAADKGITLKSDILNTFMKLNLEQVQLYPFVWENNHLGIVIMNHKIAFRLDKKAIEDIVYRFRATVSKNFDIQIVCGASTIYSPSGCETLSSLLSRMIIESKLATDTFFYHTKDTGLVMYSKNIRFTTMSTYIKERLVCIFLLALGGNDPITIKNQLISLSHTIKDFWIRPKEVIIWLLDITKAHFSNEGENSNIGLNKIKYIENLDDVEKYLLHHIMRQKNIIQISDNASYSSYVQSALTYVHTHYREHIRVKDISDSLFISPNYLSHIFKDEVGMGIINYLNTVRIEYAAHFLNTTEDKASIIAQNIGISDYKYFIKLFRRIKGVTPSEYRSQKNGL